METKRCKQSVHGGWRDLPQDILGLIVLKLVCFFDIVSFKEVCSSWRIAGQRRDKKTFSVILYFAEKAEPEGKRSNQDGVRYDDVLYISFNQKKPYELKRSTCSAKQDLRNHKMIGSYPTGWLIMLDEFRCCYLIQMFSLIRIELPNVMSCSGRLRYFQYLHVVRAVLSCNNTKHKAVIILYGPFCKQQLAIWRPGDRQWTSLEGDNYIDIALCNNEPYALQLSNGYVYVESLDIGIGSGLPVKKLRVEVPNMYSQFPLRQRRKERRLVSSSADEILVVDCLLDECIIWKVNISEERWVQMTSLNGNSLIFGSVTSAFVSASDVEDHGYKRNVVYMVRNSYDPYTYGQEPEDKRLSIYNLEDGEVERHWDSKTEMYKYCYTTQRLKPEPHRFGLIHLFC